MLMPIDIKKYVNIYTLAGAGGAGYYAHRKYGKKHGYKAVAGGAAAGLLAGMLVQKLVGPRLAPPPQVAAQQPAPQMNPGQGEYVDLDGGFGEYVPPRTNTAQANAQAEYEAARAAADQLGSLSGGGGLGSLSGAPGFDADDLDLGEILGDDFN
jgi:hypothetical protein